MQDATMEVESNILNVDILIDKDDRDIPKRISEASTFGSSALSPQIDEVTNMLKTISARMERLKL
jgi:hypothetical protein